jgi:radical SAM superfamily enzyme YgiQ (UPF0313 family)
LKDFLEKYGQILRKTEKPSRYIGGEFLSCANDFDTAKVRFLLAFPDKYEIGISNFGLKILYHILNSKQITTPAAAGSTPPSESFGCPDSLRSCNDFLADRLYAPDRDFLELLKVEELELYSLELKKPVKSFDFVGFGLQYELSYTTILKMLEMSGIEIFSHHRTSGPIVTAGGPCAYNPSALEDFIDLFFIGDGEETVLEVCQKYSEIAHLGREKVIEALAEIEGVYSPKYSRTVKRRVSKLKYDWAPTKSPVPHFSSVHDRATVEIRRGCARLCRFCQAAHTNLPVRERAANDVVELVCDYVKNTGYDEYSLLSLASNDHSEIEGIIETLNGRFKGTGVNVSLPSQRADNFSLKLANLMQEVKKSAVTLAPEAGSQRMRDVINKNLTQEQIIAAVLSCVTNGWQRVKLYFMLGLPTEREEDLDAIIELLGAINAAIKAHGLKLPNIVCSVSLFVPKPFTPFQWCAQNSLDELRTKIAYLKNKVRTLKNVKLNFHNPEISQVEALLSRADKRAGELIYRLYTKGAYMESWNENFSHALHKEVAQELGIDIEKETTTALSPDGELPWDIIDTGLEKTYLREQFERALS